MTELNNVTYCGLYCKLCSTKSRIPKAASALRDALAGDDWESFGEYIEPDFKIFWATLNKMAGYEEGMPDCREGCGDPGCKIRKCAKERGMELCPLCPDYPCNLIISFAGKHPNLISDGQRLAKIGIESWVKEQGLRCKTGFCYCDIRHPSEYT